MSIGYALKELIQRGHQPCFCCHHCSMQKTERLPTRLSKSLSSKAPLDVRKMSFLSAQMRALTKCHQLMVVNEDLNPELHHMKIVPRVELIPTDMNTSILKRATHTPKTMNMIMTTRICKTVWNYKSTHPLRWGPYSLGRSCSTLKLRHKSMTKRSTSMLYSC